MAAKLRRTLEAGKPRDAEALGKAQTIARRIREALLMALGTNLLDRAGRSGYDGPDLDRAIESLEASLQLIPRNRPVAPDTYSNLGAAYGYRFDRSNDSADADAAVACQQHAVDSDINAPATERTHRLHLYLTRLSTAHLRRFQSLGPYDDARASLEIAERAVATADAEGGDRPLALNALASSLQALNRNDEALTALEQAHRSAPEEPEYANNLAALLHQRALESIEAGHTEQAKHDLVAALRIRHRLARRAAAGDPGCPAWLNNLGQSVLTLYDTNKRTQLRAIALTLFRRAEQGNPREPVYPLNTAAALEAGDALDENEHALVAAAYQRACGLGLQSAPGVALAAAQQWATRSLLAERWSEASEAAALGEEAFRQLYATQRIRSDKMQWLAKATGLVGARAYALARGQDALGAATLLERARAFLLTDAVRIDPGASFPTGPPDRASLCETLRLCGQPVVFIAAAKPGGMALVAKPSGVNVVWLPEASEQAVFERLESYAQAYTYWAKSPKEFVYQAWKAALDEMTQWLAQAVLDPVLEIVHEESAVLVPVGPLAQLPLHAAGSAGSAGAVLDRLCVTYAPSIGSYVSARAVAARVPANSALAVADPHVNRVRGLPSARYEAWILKRAFPGSAVLPGAKATKARVLAQLGQRNLAHFACHGAADLFEPLESFLLLANGERLTLVDFEPEEIAMRLIVLSACESGIGNVALPDDVVSFPAGLLELGAAGVVASLWPVDDASTMMLMARFYDLWPSRCLEPAEALRSAQLWLRDSSSEERRQVVANLRPHGGRAARLDLPTDIGIHHWAAFIYVGA